MSRKKRISIALIAAGAVILTLGGAFTIYCLDYCHSDDYAAECLKSDDFVDVIKDGNDYMFVPRIKTGKGFIFYPGGKVETSAYAPLMNKLAHAGIYCVLPHMACNLAFFSLNAADKYINDNPDLSFYIGGHSLGGVAAASYASKNLDKLEGIIMLASFTTSDLSKSNLKVLSVTATNDKVLNWDSYSKNLSNLPNPVEYSVKGGIHSYFGSYGIQKGDGTPEITVKEQTNEVATIVGSTILLK